VFAHTLGFKGFCVIKLVCSKKHLLASLFELKTHRYLKKRQNSPPIKPAGISAIEPKIKTEQLLM
jgi:hypothetical protein